MAPWVCDPHSGGIKIPARVKDILPTGEYGPTLRSTIREGTIALMYVSGITLAISMPIWNRRRLRTLMENLKRFMAVLWKNGLSF